ncbi:MAG: small multi-drug export protein [Oscillospiraceae bacterium]|nr:small multi-drug export protein [Oscillospiraceae bacterium]MBP5168821.1 small multi-drug export protein [Oscillospiraceae bacterium]
MIPVIELRLGLPYGIMSGLKLPVAALAAILGNMLPVPFIIIFIEQVFIWLRKHLPKMDSFIAKLEKRAETKQETVDRYGALGLILLVAIPLPGTGAWTGSLVAALMKMKLRKAIPCIFLGVVLAAILMTVITKLGIFAFF